MYLYIRLLQFTRVCLVPMARLGTKFELISACFGRYDYFLYKRDSVLVY